MTSFQSDALPYVYAPALNVINEADLRCRDRMCCVADINVLFTQGWSFRKFFVQFVLLLAATLRLAANYLGDSSLLC